VTVILAHYGGIDEIGVFVVPALLAIWGLRWAEKKARRAAEDEEQTADEEDIDDG
jgi:hypothetical protein